MRIAELSRRSGTSIPSIKYYLREGLLPAGAATGRNQAEYGEAHVHRLRLIRALIDVGGLSVAAARDVLTAVDTPDLPGHSLLGAAHGSLTRPRRQDPQEASWRAARDEVIALVRRRAWYVDDDCPEIDQAADAIAAFRSLGQDDLVEIMETYADAAELVAAREVDTVIARREPARMVEGVITGTILGEAVLNALRRLAQKDASARRLVAREDLRSTYAAGHG
jgi:DNA-binding transcriptional MerR regulator